MHAPDRSNRRLAINTRDTEVLQSQLRGELILPADRHYDQVRALFNGMVDRHPAMIARCSGPADVIACVNYARNTGVPMSVKGGGHGVAGRALLEDGLVIDLSAMRSVLVDPKAGTARVQAGARLGDLDHETQAFGLAVPAGVDSRTGVAGLALGGGQGHLLRRFGLTADNLVAADVVTADGNLIRASERENDDLLWALKGGGGNFGVVTAFEFKAHPIGREILVAQAYHLFDDAREVLRFYRDFMADAADEVGCLALIMRVPPAPPFPEEHHGKLAVGLLASYSAGIDEGRKLLQLVEQFGNPIVSMMMPMPYVALQSAFDEGYPDGARYYWKSHYLSEMPDAAIDAMVAEIGDMPGEYSGLAIETLGGAFSAVDAEASAFPHRDAAFSIGAMGGWNDSENDAKVIEWTRKLCDVTKPWSTGGTYVNYIADEADAHGQQAYGSNYDRLLKVKAKYDPDHLFDAHQSMKNRQP